MATRRKNLSIPDAIPAELRDPWQNTGSSKLLKGVQVTQWHNSETGETAWVQPGMHPEDAQTAAQNTQYINEIGDELDEVEETASDRVMTLLQNARGEGRAELNVYRISNGERQYCAKYKPEEFEEGSFELLRNNFGAGEYELRLYATDPRTNRFVVRSQTRIKIAESKTPAQTDGLPNGLAQVLGTIAQGQEQMLRALVDMKQAPQKDPMEEMTKMLNMMTLMREAMGMNQQSREKSSIGEIVSAIKELKGAAAEFSPQEEKEPDTLMGMLPKVLDLVSAGQQVQQVAPAPMPTNNQVLSPVTIPQSVAGAPMTQEHSQQAENTQGENVNLMTMIKLKSYLKSLCDMAQTKTKIEDGAQYVYDKLPDDLIEIMALDNWFELLSGVAPEVKPHEKWLKEVRNKALSMFEPEN